MRLHSSLRRLAALAVVSLAAVAPTQASAHGHGSAIFTQSNAAANAVQVFEQAPDGTLTPGASYLTGGAGTGAAGLGSQGAPAIEHRWPPPLKARSNDISALPVPGGQPRL